MKTSQYMHRFERATRDMSREEILERLEGVSPAGSGAADGCAGREAGGQPADEEARSVESRAVAPGQGERLLELYNGYRAMADRAREDAQAARDRDNTHDYGRKYMAHICWDRIAADLKTLLPAASEARNERSGRRNGGAVEPEEKP